MEMPVEPLEIEEMEMNQVFLHVSDQWHQPEN